MATDRSNDIDPNSTVTQQAAGWWLLLNEDTATAADQRAFAEWVAKSPERIGAFLQAAHLGHLLQAKPTLWPDTPAEDLLRQARESRSHVTPLRTGLCQQARTDARANNATDANVARPTCPRGAVVDGATSWPPVRATARRVTIATAATVVLAALFTGGWWFYLKPLKVETTIGEQRSVLLSDGSIVTLNTASAIEVQFVKNHRTVRLMQGEALFQVAHDAVRPFDVSAGDTTVRAVGTQFNVDRHTTGTTVTVVEGRVAVMQSGPETAPNTPLEAGQQLTLLPKTGQHVVRTDVAVTIAWTQRKLVFEHRSVGEVAQEFNRYNRKLIEIRSVELRDQQITGVFQANDASSFLAFLGRIPGVGIHESSDGSRLIVTQGEL